MFAYLFLVLSSKLQFFLAVDGAPDLFFQCLTFRLPCLPRKNFTRHARSIWVSFTRTYVLSLQEVEKSQDMEYPDASYRGFLLEAIGLYVLFGQQIAIFRVESLS